MVVEEEEHKMGCCSFEGEAVEEVVMVRKVEAKELVALLRGLDDGHRRRLRFRLAVEQLGEILEAAQRSMKLAAQTDL